MKYLFSIFLLIANFAFAQKQKPNVILILTDDQGWGDFSLTKNPHLKTPAIDKLAEEGAFFTNFYVSPLCAPTRASLLTGRYHLRTGVISVSNGLEVMNKDEFTLAELFNENGYVTGMFGKWHNGSHYPNDPNGQGFQEFFGFSGGHWSNYFNTTYQHNQSFEKAEGYITDVLTDKAISFIEKNKNKPFFCYIPYNAPHTPIQVPDKYFDKYKKMNLSDELAGIYGMCENIDDNIARIASTLQKLRIEKNTIIIFLTDNGPNGQRYNGILRGVKGAVYEGGIKVPLIIKWPGHIKPGEQIAALAQHIDIFPTLIELCSLKSESNNALDGVSLAPSISGKKQAANRPIFSHVAFATNRREISPFTGSVRNNQYALVIKRNNDELFDLKNDPSQKDNIIKKFPDIATGLKTRYMNWFEDCTKDFNPDRPIPLDGSTIELPAYEASFSEGLKYKEGHGWVHDWLVNWGKTRDSISWQVTAQEGESFTIAMDYAAAKIAQPVTVEILVDGVSLVKTTICSKCDPPFINSPDRVKRKEVYEREWCKKEIGTVKISSGKNTITVVTVNPNAENDAAFRALMLSKISTEGTFMPLILIPCRNFSIEAIAL